MTFSPRATLLALTALLLCSACAEKPVTTTQITPTSQVISTLQWDELTAARSSARVSNGNLIFMR